MSDIANVIQKPTAAIFSDLQYHGGMRRREWLRREINLPDQLQQSLT
jgi:hypothetical protein